MIHRKRAVSPVIAAVLLIALVVATTAIVWGIVTGLIGSNSKLLIESTSFSDSDDNGMVDKIAFILRNIGSDDAVISQLAVTVDNIPFVNWQLLSTVTITAGSTDTVQILTLDPSQQLTTGDKVIVALTTDANDVLQEVIDIPSEFGIIALGEAGTVSVGATEVTVDFNTVFQDPVVVAVPVVASSSISRSGTNSSQYPVITAVTGNSFKIKQVTTPNDTNGVTVTDVNYIAMEKGVHYIRSMKVYADSYTVKGGGSTYTLSENFTTSPSLLAATQTNDNITIPRARGKTTNFNNITITLEDGDDSTPSNSLTETVGFILFEQEYDIVSGLQSYTSADNIKHSWQLIPFNMQYLTTPIVVAFLDREDGGDASYAAITEVTTAYFKAAIEETPKKDGWHTTETISYVALKPGLLYGT